MIVYVYWYMGMRQGKEMGERRSQDEYSSIQSYANLDSGIIVFPCFGQWL